MSLRHTGYLGSLSSLDNFIIFKYHCTAERREFDLYVRGAGKFVSS